MAKTFKLRRTGRSAMKYRKKRTTRTLTRIPYAAKPGLNVGASSRFFAPLPYKMNLRSDWTADTRYHLGLGGGTDRLPRTECYYWFIDPLNPTININNDTALSAGQRYFFCASMGSMLALYQEAVIRNSVMNVEVTADFQKVVVTTGTAVEVRESTSEPTVHFACAQVPLSYLRNSADALHTIANAGTVHSGVDYYSALTQSQGARSTTIPWGGNSAEPFRHRMAIDGYAHNGVQQTITSYASWGEAAFTPTITYAFPNPGQRNVYLFAVRMRYTPLGGVEQALQLRVAYNLQQHLVLQDKCPSFPYVRGAGNAA